MSLADQVKEGFIRVGACSDVVEGGLALRFDLSSDGFETGFVVLFCGEYYGFENRCPHAGTELDWVPGVIFDREGEFLTCSTHGALFDPVTGQCRRGPCINQSLTPLEVRQFEGEIFVKIRNRDQ